MRVARNDTFWQEASKTDNMDPAAPPPTARPAYTLEMELTERIKNEIARRTPLELRVEDEADTVLDATIRAVRPTVLLRNSRDEVLSERVNILVSFVWTDRRTGRVIARADNLQRPTEFLTARGESFTTATRRSFDYIAEQIVENMQEGF